MTLCQCSVWTKKPSNKLIRFGVSNTVQVTTLLTDGELKDVTLHESS